MGHPVVALEGGTGVVARSAFRLGYHRPEQRAFRSEVQAACRGLSPRPGTILRAVYASEMTGEAVDLENVLTYNLGTSCLSHVASAGLVLERAPGLGEDARFGADLLHEIGYYVTPDPGWGFWRPVAPLYDLLVTDPRVVVGPSAKKAWAAGRRAKTMVHGVRGQGPILVDVEVGASVGLIGVMKPLVDGLLAAGHSYEGTEQDPLLARADAVEPDIEPAELGSWLAPWDAPLGPWRFVFPRGDGVQVSPADDRIAGLRMTRSEAPGIRFTVHTAEPL